MRKIETQPFIKYISFLLVTFALAACGGGGGSKSKTNSSQPLTSSPSTISSANSSSSSNSSSSLASLAPTAEILFPPQNAFTEGSTILVRGTASDADGSIANVSVNGVKATSTDGFATWSAKLPTQVGTHNLDVIVTDNTGVTNQSPIQQKITHQATQIRQASKMAFDKKNNRALVLDDSYNGSLSPAIIAVDLDTGAQTIFSDNTMSEVKFQYPWAITIDEAGNRALVVDEPGLISIDLETGARSIINLGKISGSTEELSIRQISFDNSRSTLWGITYSGIIVHVDLLTGTPIVLEDTVSSNTAVNISYPESVQVDAVGQRLIVAGNATIIGVNINNGDRKIISDHNTPSAKNMFIDPSGIAIDSINNRFFAADPRHENIYEINSSTGEREPLFATKNPDQLTLNRPIDIFTDSKRNRLIVLDADINSLISYDLNTKSTTLITQIHTNNLDKSLYESKALTYDLQSDKLFSGNYFSILAVDAETGERTTLKKTSADESQTYQGLAYDSSKNILYVDEGFDRVIESIDLTSNKRSVIAGVGIPDFLNNPISYSAIELDESKNQLIVADSFTAAIYRIDLSTGKRSIVSDNSTPDTNAPMNYPLGLDLDSKNGKLFVADFGSQSIYQIDINSGARELLSGPSKPNTENAFISPRALAYDAKNNRLLVTDSGLHALVQVDLVTGQRSIISSNLIPNSLNSFSTPTAIQLDPDKNIAYVTDRGRNKFLSVNLSTGERTDLFTVDSPEQFIIDTKNNRAIITAESPGALYIYDFASKVLSEYEIKPEFDALTHLGVDSLNNRIIAVDEDDLLFAVDKNNGSVTQLIDGRIAIDSAIAIDSKAQKLFALDYDENLHSTDLNTGSSELLFTFRNNYSMTEDISYVTDMAFGSESNSLFIASRNSKNQNDLWRFNPSEKSLSIVFNDKTPVLTEWAEGSVYVILDDAKNLAYLVDDGRGSVTKVNLTDGSHKILSDKVTPNIFNPILEATSMTLDTKRNRLLISQYYVPGLLSIDLETGERVYVSR